MADPAFTVVFDACVLFPFALRDLLVDLATTDLFRGRWSERVHEEWTGAVLKKYPGVDRRSLARVRALMDTHVLDCVVTGYEPLIDGLVLPDPKDRHVLAAAIRCGAQVIVTRNLKDFPLSATERYGIEAQHPDDFVASLLDLSAGEVCASVKRCRGRLRRPPMSVDEYLACLEGHELLETVSELRRFKDLL